MGYYEFRTRNRKKRTLSNRQAGVQKYVFDFERRLAIHTSSTLPDV